MVTLAAGDDLDTAAVFIIHKLLDRHLTLLAFFPSKCEAEHVSEALRHRGFDAEQLVHVHAELDAADVKSA